jgi:2-dehydropantoate 2-reductase
MRICVFGAGAVGGHFAARMAAAGHQVSVVVRGEALAAIRERGIRLLTGDQEIVGRVAATDDPRQLGPQQLVLCTVKATGLTGFAEIAEPLLGADTPVLFAQNGIPWWYGIGLGADRPAPPNLSALDPTGALGRAIAPERVIGGVIQSANEVVAPGVVRNDSPARNILTIGDADDRQSDRIRDTRSLLIEAGIASPDVVDIRRMVWRKLLVNMTVSILCLVTGRTGTVVRDHPDIAALFLALAAEAVAIPRAHGIPVDDFDPEQVRRGVQHHLPSIRQDFERGRPLELASQLLLPLAFARAAGLETPRLDMLAALAGAMAGAA